MSLRGQRIILGLLLAALLLFLLRIAWPFASALVVASLLASVLHSANARLSRRLRRPGLASLLTTLATVIVLGTTVSFVCFTVVKSSAKAYKALNQLSVDGGGGIGSITATTDRIVDALATRLPAPKETIRADVFSWMKVGASYLASRTGGAIQNLTSILVTSVLATLFLYYMLRYGEQWVGWVAAQVPLSPGVTAKLLRAAHQSIVANVTGILGVAVAQGLFLGLGFWLVGIGSPLQWGTVGGIASAIPFVGASLVWLPAVIGFAVTGSYGKAVVLAVWGSLVVGSLDNFLRPWIVGARQEQHPVLIGFAMLGGTYALGPLGLLFGPLVVSLTGAVMEEIQRMSPLADAAPLRMVDDEEEQTSKTRSQIYKSPGPTVAVRGAPKCVSAEPTGTLP